MLEQLSFIRQHLISKGCGCLLLNDCSAFYSFNISPCSTHNCLFLYSISVIPTCFISNLFHLPLIILPTKLTLSIFSQKKNRLLKD